MSRWMVSKFGFVVTGGRTEQGSVREAGEVLGGKLELTEVMHLLGSRLVEGRMQEGSGNLGSRPPGAQMPPSQLCFGCVPLCEVQRLRARLCVCPSIWDFQAEGTSPVGATVPLGV